MNSQQKERAKDRLVDLLMMADMSLFGTDKPFAEVYANCLIKNGTIVPPCRVGDTVYLPWRYNGVSGIAKLTVTHIIINSTRSYIKTDFNSDDEYYYELYKCGNFDFDDFEKIVFLNIQDAEKQLKEMEG